MSIALWDLYKCDGLPLYGRIYDKAVSSRGALYQRHQNSKRLIQPACRYLFAGYRRLENLNDKGFSTEHWMDVWCKKKVT